MIAPYLSTEDIEKKFGSTLRKLVFSRSLRILPLPQQVGAVEALAVIVNEFPSFLSIKDQHFLSFLSELLKMCSVSDGEVSVTERELREAGRDCVAGMDRRSCSFFLADARFEFP